MDIKKVTISDVNGNGGREYRVHFSDGCWLSFESIPGDNKLYCGHTAAGASVDQYASEARKLLISDFVGKQDKQSNTLTAEYGWTKE